MRREEIQQFQLRIRWSDQRWRRITAGGWWPVGGRKFSMKTDSNQFRLPQSLEISHKVVKGVVYGRILRKQRLGEDHALLRLMVYM